MRYLTLLLLALFAPIAIACPTAATMPDLETCVAWQAPTENVDGSALTDLAGFILYTGSISGNYDHQVTLSATAAEYSPTASEMSMTSPGPGGGDVDRFMVVTALDGEGNESAFSNEVRRPVTFPDTLPPMAPNILPLP